MGEHHDEERASVSAPGPTLNAIAGSLLAEAGRYLSIDSVEPAVEIDGRFGPNSSRTDRQTFFGFRRDFLHTTTSVVHRPSRAPSHPSEDGAIGPQVSNGLATFEAVDGALPPGAIDTFWPVSVGVSELALRGGHRCCVTMSQEPFGDVETEDGGRIQPQDFGPFTVGEVAHRPLDGLG